MGLSALCREIKLENWFIPKIFQLTSIFGGRTGARIICLNMSLSGLLCVLCSCYSFSLLTWYMCVLDITAGDLGESLTKGWVRWVVHGSQGQTSLWAEEVWVLSVASGSFKTSRRTNQIWSWYQLPSRDLDLLEHSIWLRLIEKTSVSQPALQDRINFTFICSDGKAPAHKSSGQTSLNKGETLELQTTTRHYRGDR